MGTTSNTKQTRGSSSSNSKSHDQPRRRGEAPGTAVGVGNAALSWWKSTSRTTKHVMDKYRARKERKRQQTARSLRSYQKACKAEGYSPGQGASRRRRRRNVDDKAKHDDDDDDEEDDKNELVANAPSTNRKSNKDQAPLMKENQNIEKDKDSDDDNEGGNRPERNDDDDDKDDMDLVPKTRKRRASAGLHQAALQAKVARLRQDKLDAAQERERHEQVRRLKLQQRRQRTRQMKQRTAKGQPILHHQVQDLLQKLQQKQQSLLQPQQSQNKQSSEPCGTTLVQQL